jgi:hypothetical protein
MTKATFANAKLLDLSGENDSMSGANFQGATIRPSFFLREGFAGANFRNATLLPDGAWDRGGFTYPGASNRLNNYSHSIWVDGLECLETSNDRCLQEQDLLTDDTDEDPNRF